MNSPNTFAKVNHFTLRNASGVTVEVPGSNRVIYTDGARSVIFRVDPTYACDLVLTYLIYPPEIPTWRETGEAITPLEWEALKSNTIHALKLFNILALFIAPESLKAKRALALEEGPHNV